jgi:hypothetical protein
MWISGVYYISFKISKCLSTQSSRVNVLFSSFRTNGTLSIIITHSQNSMKGLLPGTMKTICILISALSVLPGSSAQVEQCVPLATSTTCAAFNGSSASVDDFMVGL